MVLLKSLWHSYHFVLSNMFTYEQSTKHIFLNKMLDVRQSHPLCTIHFGQYILSLIMQLRWGDLEIGAVMSCPESSQLSGLIQKVGRSYLKALSLCAAVLHAAVLCSKTIARLMCHLCINTYLHTHVQKAVKVSKVISNKVRHKLDRKIIKALLIQGKQCVLNSLPWVFFRLWIPHFSLKLALETWAKSSLHNNFGVMTITTPSHLRAFNGQASPTSEHST